MLYLELGLMPIYYIIILRKILYLQHILKQRNSNSLIYQVFKAQLERPKSKDWVSQIMKDMEEIEIYMELIEIEQMNKKQKVRGKAFEYLINENQKHKSVMHIEHTSFKLAAYLVKTI